MLSPGDKIGPYTIRASAGQGGMAVVYQAWHEGLHRFEALKVPRGAGEVASDSAYIQRLLAEARVAAGLHHPHIVAIHGVSEPLAPIPYFAMDWIQGRDLAQILGQKRAFSLAETTEILEKVALALDYAHSRGVVHRDIKPANILLAEESGALVPKVVDFGISRAAEDDEHGGETKLTRSGMIVGTPEYMSPEQAGSGEKVDFRTDIYSLGVVAYEMMCGAPPFTAGSGVSRLSILISHVRDVAPLWEKFPDFPPAAGAAILRALAKAPDDRPASCAAFIAELQAAQTQNSAFSPFPSAENVENTPFDAARFERDEAATIFERPISLSDVQGPPPTLLPRPNIGETALEVPIETPTVATYSLRARLEAAAQTPLPAGKLEEETDSRFAPEPAQIAAPTGRAPRPASRVALLAGIGGLLVGGALVLMLGRDAPAPELASSPRAGTMSSAVALPLQPTPRAPAPVAPQIARAPVAPPRAQPRLRVVKTSRTSPIAFATTTRRSSRRALGTRYLAQRGQSGERETTLQISYQGEREMARRVLSERVTRQPTPQIEVIGTRVSALPARPRHAIAGAPPVARPRVRRASVQSAPRPQPVARKIARVAPRARPVVKRRAIREAPLPP